MGVKRFFGQAGDAFAPCIENAVGHFGGIGHAGHSKAGFLLQGGQVEVFEIGIGKQIAVHQQEVFALEFFGQRQGAGGAQRLIFADVTNLYAFAGAVAQVIDQLLAQIAQRNMNGFDAKADQAVDVVLYDGFVAQGQQGFGGVVGERTQTLAPASGHDDGLERQQAAMFFEVVDFFDAALLVEQGQQAYAFFAGLFKFGQAKAFVDVLKTGKHEFIHRIVEAQAANQAPADVAVGEGAQQASPGVDHKERQVTGHFAQPFHGFDKAGLVLYQVEAEIFHCLLFVSVDASRLQPRSESGVASPKRRVKGSKSGPRS